jgi:polysaccharide biosynthesis transport protein
LESVPHLESIRTFLRICERRKGFALATAAFVILVSVCACAFTPSTYTASSRIQIDGFSGSSELNARAIALKSDALAFKVIEDLKLEPDHHSLDERRDIVNAFRDHLTVKAIPGTHQLEVNYSDSDPKLAAAVINHLVDVYADDTITTTVRATLPGSQWIEGQLDELHRQSEALQSKLVGLQMNNEVVDPDLQGKRVIYTSTLVRLRRSIVLLAQARMNYLLRASVAEVVKTENPVSIAQLTAPYVLSATSESVRASLTRIQYLVRRQTMLQMQTDRDRATMRILQQSLKGETRLAVKRAEADVEAASKAEQNLRAEYEVDRAVSRQLNDRSIEGATVSAQAGQSRQLYLGMLKQLKNAGMLEVSHSSNVTVVTKAAASSSQGSSRAPLYLVLGGGFGVFFGCCVAFLVDVAESRKKENEQGWSVRVSGSRIPRIRGMSSAAFKASREQCGLTQAGRQPAAKLFRVPVSRATTNAGPRRLILLHSAAGGRTQAMP